MPYRMCHLSSVRERAFEGKEKANDKFVRESNKKIDQKKKKKNESLQNLSLDSYTNLQFASLMRSLLHKLRSCACNRTDIVFVFECNKEVM